MAVYLLSYVNMALLNFFRIDTVIKEVSPKEMPMEEQSKENHIKRKTSMKIDLPINEYTVMEGKCLIL